MVHPPYDPTVQLLCTTCQKPTRHLLVDFSNNPISALTLVYECQACGQTKKTYDLNTLPELKASTPINISPTHAQAANKAEPPAIPIERGPQIER